MKRLAVATGSAMAAALALSLGAVPARAEDASCPAIDAPVSVAYSDSGLDESRGACAESGWRVSSRATALIDTPNFYGTLAASLFAGYRLAHETGFELGVYARLVDYRFAQTAVFQDDAIGFGPVFVELLRPAETTWLGRPVTWSTSLRMALPFTSSEDEAPTFELLPAALASWKVAAPLRLHGRAAAPLRSVLAAPGPEVDGALALSLDASYAPLSSLAFLAGVAGQGSTSLDYIAPRIAVRAGSSRIGAFELSVSTMVAGDNGTDLVGLLGYRFQEDSRESDERSRLLDWAR